MVELGRGLEVASIIGAELCRDAIRFENRCNWVGAAAEEMFGGLHIVQRTFGPDIYNGLSGIALFLAELYRYDKRRILLDTAVAALHQAVESRGLVEERFRAGFYSGGVGVGYALLRVGRMAGREDLVEAGSALLIESIPDSLVDEASRDVVMGAAGCVPVLLAAAPFLASERFSEKAIELGRMLIGVADRGVDGWSWRTYRVPEGVPNLTGFSHGAAGIAWALLELYRTTNEAAFLEAAQEGIRYEHRWFDATRNNWVDVRSGANAGTTDLRTLTCGSAWCHGAPGIGLGRVRAFEITGDQSVIPDIRAAAAATAEMLRAGGPGQASLCLCHGVAGNCELFVEIQRVFGDQQAGSFVAEIFAPHIDAFLTRGLRGKSGVPDGSRTPGMMLGDAGVGYFLLRMHREDEVPSLLLPRPEQLLSLGCESAPK